MEKHRHDRIQSFAFIAVTLAVLCVSCLWVFHTSKFINPGNVAPLDNLINPNDAPVASLMRLPGIGPAKAQAIVDYRKNFNDGRIPPFRGCSDLQKVEGIGSKTAQDLGEFLRFD